MRFPLRALLLTAAATGAFALALNAVRPKSAAPAAPSVPPSPEVEADHLPAAEREALLQELATHL